MWRGICWVWLQQTVEPGKQLLCPTGMHCLVGGVSAGPETQAEAKYWSELGVLQSAVTTWPVWVWFHECLVLALNFSLNLKDLLDGSFILEKFFGVTLVSLGYMKAAGGSISAAPYIASASVLMSWKGCYPAQTAIAWWAFQWHEVVLFCLVLILQWYFYVAAYNLRHSCGYWWQPFLVLYYSEIREQIKVN